MLIKKYLFKFRQQHISLSKYPSQQHKIQVLNSGAAQEYAFSIYSKYG
jgi:hypothetical protein